MRWRYFRHLFQFVFLIFCEFKLSSSAAATYPLILPSNASISYDSTTKDIFSYNKSQGLVVVDKSEITNVQICHYNNMFQMLASESINNIYYILKVVYILSSTGEEYEYLINFNNERFRGHRIPVITQNNNKPTATSYFYNSISIFQISYIFADSIKPTLTDLIGVEVVHSASTQEIYYYLCLKQGVYIAKLNEGTNPSSISFSRLIYVDLAGCQSIIKQNYSSVLINSRISCNLTQCSTFTENVDITVFLESYDEIFRQPLQSINKNTWEKKPYTWTTIPIKYPFNYKKEGIYTLYIFPDQTNTKILLNIRDSIDSQIFVGELSGISNLDNKIISYNSLGLYVIETTKKTNASIVAFCIDSTYDSTAELCIRKTNQNCEFENNAKCLKCNSLSFLDSSTGQCSTCPDPCETCSTATICGSCKSDFRDPLNSCKCSGGRVEQQNVRLLSKQTLRFLYPTQCVCPVGTYEDSTTKNCISCGSLSTFCLECDSLGCTRCSSGSYILNNQCIQCQPNCNSCDQTQCLVCTPSYYINASKQCSSCNSLVPNCSSCDASGCTQCTVGYYLLNQQCLQCRPECNNGCINGTICVDCYTTYRDRLNQCACIGGRTEILGEAGKTECVCQTNQYWDSKNNLCKQCSTTFGGACNTCTESGCTQCQSQPLGSSQYFIDPTTGSCVSCNTKFNNCLQCSASSCSQCMTDFYLDGNNNCSICNIQCQQGCSSALKCNSCFTSFRDVNNKCDCVSGRYEYSTSSNQRLLKSEMRRLNVYDPCVCNIDRVELVDGTCQLCTILYGAQCSTCNLQTCQTCIGGSYVNEKGACECPSDEYLNAQSCIKCISQFPSECKKCNSTTCLDCGDVNSQYFPTQGICGCKQGYFIESRINNSFTCSECTKQYGSNCSECNETQCLNCLNGYIYNSETKLCECPTGNAVKNNQCQSCSTLYQNKFCTVCDDTQCTSCSQSERNPAQNCSCYSKEAIDINDKCYLCQISLTTQNAVALVTFNNINVSCNFSSTDNESPNFVKGSMEIYLILSYSYINNQGIEQKKSGKYLLSNTNSVVNIVLPHGNHQIQSIFTATESLSFIQTTTLDVNVSSIYSNMQQLYKEYFAFKNSSLKLDTEQILKYLAEILEIKKVQGEFVSSQKNACSSISQNGSVCICKSSNAYFADCSGSKSYYTEFQKVILQYIKFFSDQTLNLTTLQQKQLALLLPLVTEQVDSSFLAKDNSQVENLLNTINESVSSIKDVNNLPSNFEEKATQLAEQISGVFGSTTISQTNSQKAMEMVTFIQKAALQTINPFYEQQNKPNPVEEIKTDNILLDQKLIKCPTSTFTSDKIEYIIGEDNKGSGNERILQNINKSKLKIRLLDTSSCEVISPGIVADPKQYYNGVSASIYKTNPYFNSYDLPYKEQQYELFTTQYQVFNAVAVNSDDKQRLLQNLQNIELQNKEDLRGLADTVSNSSSQQLYSLQFQVVETNPKDNTNNFNYTLFKCIYLNETSTNSMKWTKCPTNNFLTEKRALSCSCPLQSTYVYDYDHIFDASDIVDSILQAKKKQTTLIIIAIIMASIFILLIILYALIYKPKHIIHELAQLGKQSELIDSNQVKINDKLYQAKIRDTQSQGEELKKQSYKVSAQSTPYNQLQAHNNKNRSPFSPKAQQNQFINSNSNNNNQYSSAKFNSNNQHHKFDTFGNNSSFQYNRKAGNSFQEVPEHIATSNNRSIFQNPSIFNTINKHQNNNITENPLPLQERKDYTQTFENNYTERIIQDQTVRSEKKIEEVVNQNYVKNIIATNRDLQSNTKLQQSNSDENLELNSKANFTSKKVSKSRSSSSIKSGKKNLQMVEEDIS